MDRDNVSNIVDVFPDCTVSLLTEPYRIPNYKPGSHMKLYIKRSYQTSSVIIPCFTL